MAIVSNNFKTWWKCMFSVLECKSRHDESVWYNNYDLYHCDDAAI